MGLIKQCSNCSQKGMFLKIIDDLCPKCHQLIKSLESSYTNILTELMTDSNIKSNDLEKKLEILILEVQKLNISHSTINLNNCNNLLLKVKKSSSNIENFKLITTEKSNINNTKLNFNHLKKEFSKNGVLPLESTTTSPTTNSSHNINCSIPLIKIKNLLEPVEDVDNSTLNLVLDNTHKKELALKLNISNKDAILSSLSDIKLNTKENTEINLNASAQNKLISPHSLKDNFELNNLKKKTELLLQKIDNTKTSLDSLAEIYFSLKDNVISKLIENNITMINDINLENKLNELKNTLCIRTKKTELELFDFFNYISIFVQTTGLNPINSDIIEISATKISYGKVIDEFYSLVNPVKTIKISVSKNTGILNSDVENSPTIDVLLPKLMKFIGNYKLISYNPKPVDLFLNTTLQHLNMPILEEATLSVVNLYRIRYKNYHGFASPLFDITSACKDLLSDSDLNHINEFKSISISNSNAIYKLFEILKYKYK
ncbi:MAG: exonuclease domain-containing protein [Sarcina sp.]